MLFRSTESVASSGIIAGSFCAVTSSVIENSSISNVLSPLLTLSPTDTVIFFTVPEAGDGISMVALSLSKVIKGVSIDIQDTYVHSL